MWLFLYSWIFPTINLIDNKKELVKEIYVSEEALKTEGYKKLMTLVDKIKLLFHLRL